MKIRFAPFVLLFLISQMTLASDDAAIKQLVKEKVQDMCDAILKDDFGKVVDLTHPKIVELMGGRKKMISTMEAGSKEMKSPEFTLLSIKANSPSDPVKSGSDLYLTVPFEMEARTPDGKFIQKSFTIGLSGDGGKTWVFVNGDVDIKLVKQILPNLPDSLKLPEREKPVKKKE
jgi:hypothetical protein